MILQEKPPLHLTYCMNVHPGETWEDNFKAVRKNVISVKRLVNRPGPFGVGLRLNRTAATTLQASRQLVTFKEYCRSHNLYVFTINGFPYGRFHGAPVKADVYKPDWRESERLEYTNSLIDILAELLPEGVNGSISTVPGSYKSWITTTADVRKMTKNIADAAAHAAAAMTRTGKRISIALEPEPDGFIENTDETTAFFNGPLRKYGSARLRKNSGCSKTTAENILANHTGICFDTAHMAVAFEDPADSLIRLRQAGVPVSKIHLSAALEVTAGADAPNALKNFCEDVYLHQTRRRRPDGVIHAFPDLPDALASPTVPGEQWRVHFHVPLHFTQHNKLASTASTLNARFTELIREGITEHLEIETYTYGVMPTAMACPDITEEITREYQWAINWLSPV